MDGEEEQMIYLVIYFIISIIFFVVGDVEVCGFEYIW